MEVAFRADASLDIGTGHVMRCLTLADALRASGAACHFVCRAHAGNLLEAIAKRGHIVHSLPLATTGAAPMQGGEQHAHWLGADWETDARQTQTVLEGIEVDWLIVDHYALDARWESRLRTTCKRVAVLDDLADRPHACELLVDQNLGHTIDDYADLVPSGSRVLAGPTYAMLRSQFAELRERSLICRQTLQVRRLLISLGGVDKDNITTEVLIALRGSTLPADCTITVVMGAQAPFLDQVIETSEKMPWSTKVCVDVRDMAQLMLDCDLALGAAGSTSWERCCLGVPTLLLVLADNQRSIATALHTAGAAIALDADSLMDDLPATLNRLISSPDVRFALSNAASQITDGLGAARVLAVLAEQ